MLQLISQKVLSPWHIMNGNFPFRKSVNMLISLAVIIFQSDRLVKPNQSIVHFSNRGLVNGNGSIIILPRIYAFAIHCVSAVKIGKMKLSGNAKDSAFLSEAFSNWKDATIGFANHKKSTTHKRAVEVVVTLSQTHRDIEAEMLSTCKSHS